MNELNKKDKEKVEVHTFKFHGKKGEYFNIWIVNLLLSIVTLGIYSAWATVKNRRYFYGNTELSGERFDYHAKPTTILLGRLIAVSCLFILLITIQLNESAGMFGFIIIALLTPYFIVRSMRFNYIMSSFRGVRFNFKGAYGRAYYVMLILPILYYLVFVLYFIFFAFSTYFTTSESFDFELQYVVLILFTILIITALFFIAFNHIQLLNFRYRLDNSFLGKTAFKTDINFLSFVFISLKTVGLFVLIGLLMVLFSSITGTLGGFLSRVEFYEMTEGSTAVFYNFIFFYIVFLIIYLICLSYYFVSIRNYSFKQTRLGDSLQLNSTMEFLPFTGLLLSNFLLVVVTLGLAIPIARIRIADYTARNTQIKGELSSLNFVDHSDKTNSAIGDSFVQTFDLG